MLKSSKMRSSPEAAGSEEDEEACTTNEGSDHVTRNEL